MKTISNTDFDKLESLLKNNHFDDLTWQEKRWVLTHIDEEEYNSMSRIFYDVEKEFKKEMEIEPDHEIKQKLDVAFNKFNKSTALLRAFRFKIPAYQSVAVAFLFFITGFLANIYKSTPVIVRDRVEVIKYVTKNATESTLKSAIKFNHVARKTPKKAVQEKLISNDKSTNDMVDNKNINPEIELQQEIAMLNFNRVLSEKNGSSIEGDTVLQKMLVTVY